MTNLPLIVSPFFDKAFPREHSDPHRLFSHLE
jgi:hypothetical protein